MNKFKKVVFAKNNSHNIGNIVANTINIKKEQKNILTPGTLWVPIFTNEDTGEHYLIKVMEVVGEPTKAKHKTTLKPAYNMQVPVRTIIESATPIKVKKNAINSALRYGTTKIDASSDGVKGIAYKEFERFVALAIRS